MKEEILAANARYAAQVNLLLEALAPFSHEQVNRKPADGGWSAIQTLHHLVLVEENALAYLHKKLSFNPPLEKAGLGAALRGWLLRVGLKIPFKFKAPKSAGSERIPEEGSLNAVAARWKQIRGEWADFLEIMSPEHYDKAVFRHPGVGRLGWLQTIGFIRTHFERHQRQVWRAVKQDDFNPVGRN